LRITGTLILCIFFGGNLIIGDGKTPSQARLQKNKPTVYIEFERTGNRPPLFASETGRGIWLRLYNNTKWSIVLDMHGVPSKTYGDASLIYDVLDSHQVINKGSCHACSFNSLGPGRSLLFSVPIEHLANGQAIRVRFKYSWESSENVAADHEPEHYVYFYSSRLPKNVSEESQSVSALEVQTSAKQ